jgi:5-aminolevulinate synthase
MRTEAFYGEAVADLAAKGGLRVFRQLNRQSSTPAIAVYTAPDGRRKAVTVWCSNDYLGMSKHPALIETMLRVTKEMGVGAGGVRSLSGTTDYHVMLEHELARLHDKPAALLFNSGFVANETTLSTLISRTPGMIVFSDKLIHASMIHGIRNARAEKRIFEHNDPDSLEQELRSVDARRPKLVVLEAVYSMDGDVAPLAPMLDAAERHGAMTYLDEVHAVGMYGPKGAGMADRDRVMPRVTIVQGTLGKAFGVVGGYIAASREIVDFVRQFAPGMIFSTALPPAVAATASESVRIVSRSGDLRRQLAERAERLKACLRAAGLPFMPSQSHIVPVLVGDPQRCTDICDLLLSRYSLCVQPIKFPTVARGTERLRITPAPYHSTAMMDELISALAEVWTELGLPFARRSDRREAVNA